MPLEKDSGLKNDNTVDRLSFLVFAGITVTGDIAFSNANREIVVWYSVHYPLDRAMIPTQAWQSLHWRCDVGLCMLDATERAGM